VQCLERELTQTGKAIERLLAAYQEGLLGIEQLRERMPMLRQRERSIRTELQAIADQTPSCFDPVPSVEISAQNKTNHSSN